MSALASYQWPGNIRELQNFIERSVIVSQGTFEPADGELEGSRGHRIHGPVTLEQVEREHIRKILEQTRWVVAGPNGAAARLGIKRSTLYFRIRSLGSRAPNRNQFGGIELQSGNNWFLAKTP